MAINCGNSLSTNWLWTRYGDISVYPCYGTQPDGMGWHLRCGQRMRLGEVDVWYDTRLRSRQSSLLGYVGALQILTVFEAWKKWLTSDKIVFE